MIDADLVQIMALEMLRAVIHKMSPDGVVTFISGRESQIGSPARRVEFSFVLETSGYIIEHLSHCVIDPGPRGGPQWVPNRVWIKNIPADTQSTFHFLPKVFAFGSGGDGYEIKIAR